MSADLRLRVDAPALLAFQVGVAGPDAYDIDETITLTVDGRPLPWRELTGPTGDRTWLVDSPAGDVRCHYQADVTGTSPPSLGGPDEHLLYLRPSRYCESDRILGFAGRLFHDISGSVDVINAVSSWVGTQLEYVSGSSGPTDGAVDTLLAGKGVCRDFAHLTIALLRAKEIPARLAAVYAPGLEPMDFHAVTEAWIDGTWYVVDSTLLAPRPSLLRIATGRDAADTSFLTSHGGRVDLLEMAVSATVDGALPEDDIRVPVQLG